MKPVLLPLVRKHCQAFYLWILFVLQQAGVGGSAANWPFPGTMHPRGEVRELPSLFCSAQMGETGREMHEQQLFFASIFPL